MSNLEKDMERSPEQYKEYIEEISQVDPDYPSHDGGYIACQSSRHGTYGWREALLP